MHESLAALDAVPGVEARAWRIGDSRDVRDVVAADISQATALPFVKQLQRGVADFVGTLHLTGLRVCSPTASPEPGAAQHEDERAGGLEAGDEIEDDSHRSHAEEGEHRR